MKSGKLVYDDDAMKITQLSCAYRSGKFYAANEECEFDGSGKAIVCRETLLMFDLKFIDRYEDVTIGTTLAEFFWLNGPPGCGKTYMIMENFAEDVAVLTATKAGRDDVTSLRKRGYTTKDTKRVRTVASAVMNPDTTMQGITKVLVDEATMIHPGQLVFLAARMPLIESFVLIGDVNQISFIDRLRMGNVQYHKAADVCMKLPDLSVTRRCPAQIVHALQARYPGLKTTSEELGSVTVVRSIVDVPMHNDRLYMTFTQAEKTELKAKLEVGGLRTKVLTIAEAQGQT